MRRRYLLWIVTGIVIGLSSCTINPPFPADPLPVASPIDPSKAYANWRWIGIKRDADAPGCPEVAGFGKGTLLFGDPYQPQEDDYDYRQESNDASSDPEVLAARAELNRFCVYEPDKPFEKGGALLPIHPEIIRFDRDRAILVPSAKTLDAKVWESLSKHFLSQVGPLETLPAIDESPDVRLAILDTQPEKRDFKKVPGTSWHGYSIAHIARNLVCDPRSQDLCAATITTRLVFPIVRFDPLDKNKYETDPYSGGFFGTLTDLSQAIEAEVKTNRPGQRLVINLSVAWNGDLFGGLHEKGVCEMPADVQAVYRALKLASASGVLVLAAAGNRQYGPDLSLRTGPLLPAAWEKRLEDDCGNSLDKPLLYAVGGVRSDGGPLPNTRVQGLPRRVTYADHAAVSSLNPGELTKIYTGSSVSTAVVSAIAAVVWNAYPDLNAHELMRILDASGDELPLDADFWFGAGSNAPKIHRLSLCSALELVRSCAPDFSPDCRARYQCDWDRRPPQLSNIVKPMKPITLNLDTRPIPSPCRSEKIFCPPDAPWPPLCPSDRYSETTSQPWLLTQPGDTPCPNCVVTPPPPDNSPITSIRYYTLHGTISTDWNGGPLTGATLDIGAESPISFMFDQTVDQGQELTVTFEVPSSLSLTLNGTTQATLSFFAQNTNTSAQSPVLIAR